MYSSRGGIFLQGGKRFRPRSGGQGLDRGKTGAGKVSLSREDEEKKKEIGRPCVRKGQKDGARHKGAPARGRARKSKWHLEEKPREIDRDYRGKAAPEKWKRETSNKNTGKRSNHNSACFRKGREGVILNCKVSSKKKGGQGRTGRLASKGKGRSFSCGRKKTLRERPRHLKPLPTL